MVHAAWYHAHVEPSTAKTIQIFLPDGAPRGLRIAEMTTRIVQAVQVPRARVADFLNRPGSQLVAVYFLFGPTDGRAKPEVYVGQTEDPATRLRDHDARKEFWQTAVFLVSRTRSFTQVHVRYLEWYCIDQIASAGRYQLENGNRASRPFIPEPLEADVLDAFDVMRTLLGTLGFVPFEPPAQMPSQSPVTVYSVRGPDAQGQGRLTDDGFVVLRGSICRRDSVESASTQVASLRQPLLDADVIGEDDEGRLAFFEDYTFGSPSSAAMAILGRTSNGWVDWKDGAGRTLDAERKAAAT